MVDATIPQERCDFYVYVIFRPDGEPCYVGKGMGGRWKQHVNRASNKALKAIYSASGGDLPIVKVREDLTNEEACETEMRFIVAIGRADLDGGPLVNLTDGGEGAPGYRHTPEYIAACRERRLSDPQRLNLRLLNLGKKQSTETIAKRSAALLGKTCSPETRAKIGTGNCGKIRSPETRAKIGASQFGRKRSPEIGAKISAANLGKKRSPEARARMSGRKHSLEARAKIGAAHLGKKNSPEIRARMSAGRLQAHAERVRAEAGPWLIDPGPEYHARAVLYHEDARRMASQPAEQMSLDL